MSLSARVALDPSRRVACAEWLFPLSGLGIALATLVARWPAAMIVVLALLGLACGLVARRRSLRASAEPYRFALSDRPEFGVVLPDGTSLDARLVGSSVAWPGFWMVAFAEAGSPRVTRFAVLPIELHPDTRRSFSRYLVWATRATDTGDGTKITLR